MKALNSTHWFPVCDASDLLVNEGVCVRMGEHQIAIFSIPGSERGLYAIANYDPIGGANVLSRGIVGDINGELVVASPLYKQHFALETGRCLEDEQVSVAVYEVARDKNTILIGIDGA